MCVSACVHVCMDAPGFCIAFDSRVFQSIHVPVTRYAPITVRGRYAYMAIWGLVCVLSSVSHACFVSW